MSELTLDKNGQRLESGDKVMFLLKNKKTFGIFSHRTPQNEAYIKNGKGDKKWWRKFSTLEKIGNATKSAEGVEGEENEEDDFVFPKLLSVNEKYSINERFGFLESLTRMTIRNKIVSLLITGEGGIGKTYTVMKEIKETKMVEDEHYHIIKGFSTAKGLYETLYYCQDKLIIFDDCDEVLKNDIAQNILKGALDSYSERIVSWVKSQSTQLGDIPEKFEFKGRIIFISNMKKHKIPQPILSRAAAIDLTMSPDEKIGRMENIIEKIRPDVDMELKQTALGILRDNKVQINDLNFRTLLKAISALSSGEENVEKLTEFMIMS